MPKKFIKRFMPDHEKVRQHKHLQIFGNLLHDPNLWHLNRRSASGAFAVGLFMAFLPLPMQMLFAAAAAIIFRVNLPVSVGLVWITNPLTIPPIFYACYRLGAWILGCPIEEIPFELTVEWFEKEMSAIWQPLLLGSFIAGIVSASIGFLAIRGLWRLHLIQHYKARKARRAARKQARNTDPH